MTIKAYAAYQPSLRVKPYEYELAGVGEREVLVLVTHCSVGRGDIFFLQNKYDLPPDRFPLIAGHECVGIVDQIGKNVRSFKRGDRVGVGYQVWSCGECEYCLDNHEQLCQKQKVLVGTEPGAFASHVVADERFVFRVPDSISSEAATPLLCSGLTAYSAVKKAGIQPGMHVGVIGIGGLGHLAVQLLHFAETRVTAFSSKRGKNAEEILRMGAQEVLPYESNKAKTGAFDRLFAFTHAHINVDFYVKLLRPAGELWLVGSDTNQSSFSSSLLNDRANRSIRGSFIGSPVEMDELLALASDHTIQGHVHALPMSKLNDALRIVAADNAPFRVIVTN